VIYNQRLFHDPPPQDLSQLVSINRKIKKTHGVLTILWE
jgi:hypothetical protein